MTPGFHYAASMLQFLRGLSRPMAIRGATKRKVSGRRPIHEILEVCKLKITWRAFPDQHDSDEHGEARVKVTPLKVDQPLKQTYLPVAAMPLHRGEVWAAYRAKVRPCLVLGSTDAPPVDKQLTMGMPKYMTAPMLLVAPHYGADKDGARTGYNPEFIERIRHCEYPQFVWNPLPILGGPKESILRLDQI